MSGSVGGYNPQLTQGVLNRILTQITLASYPALNVAASNMGKSFARLSFDDQFNDQIGTATGVVNSPAPYVMATIVVGLLRTQSLSQNWLSPVAVYSPLGSVTAYTDATTFNPISLAKCSIMSLDPGAFDGTDPVVAVTLRGVYYINSNLWG